MKLRVLLFLALNFSIFSATYASDVTSEGNRTIKEGRTWRYYSEQNCFMDPRSDIYLDLCFSGTTVINGVEYFNCYVWKEDNDFSSNTASLIAYMREEEGKIYVRYLPETDDNANKNGIDIIPYSPFFSLLKHDLNQLSEDEYLLFDPNLKIGEEMISCENPTKGIRYTVKGIKIFESMGHSYKMYSFSDGNESFSFASVLGDYHSLLPIPGSDPISYSEGLWNLIQVVDTDTNEILYDSSQLTISSNVNTINSIILKETYYDLNGIEISSPTEKGIYIRRQLLDSGLIKTDKILVK